VYQQLNDTIIAVSSPTSEEKVIIRIAGPDTINILQQIFSPTIRRQAGIVHGSVAIDDELQIDAKLYLFLAPHSYTGDDVAEVHFHTNQTVTEALMENLLTESLKTSTVKKSAYGTSTSEKRPEWKLKHLRIAAPGEFTARAYLNGKIDLAQAEAVCEIVTGSNKFQLAAAEKLLAGGLTETTAQIRSDIIDCLSLVEAGLDFSQEDIEFITTAEATKTLNQIKENLQQLLVDSISYEALIDLPSVGIAGSPNAGKSTLFNKLLGKARSIVSDQRKTTVDVLTGLLTLNHCRCVLFDCAGLTAEPDGIIDELAQTAAIQALQNSSVVVFCVDISKADWDEDIAIRKLIVLNPASSSLIPVATKSDLLSEDVLTERLSQLNKLFGTDFLAVSAKEGTGVGQLKDIIDNRIVELSLGCAKDNAKYQIPDIRHQITLTARHRSAVTEAIENISRSVEELKTGRDEVAAMMLRAACQAISNIEQENIDEQILEQIFKRFCIGK